MLQLKTILHPTDFSEYSKAALEVAGALAHDHGAKLIVVHVVPRFVPVAAESIAEALIPQDVEPLRKLLHETRPPQSDVAVRHILDEGDAAEEILRIANENQCDLIVMGTHGRRGLTRLVMGSVAERVTRSAPCAVVTTRHPLKAMEPNSTEELHADEFALPTSSILRT
jgi:nucleotide-binding universal stress UspA family protein